jgi:hypothetical protein
MGNTFSAAAIDRECETAGLKITQSQILGLLVIVKFDSGSGSRVGFLLDPLVFRSV